MTIKELFQSSLLAGPEKEIILSHLLKKPRLYLHLNPQKQLSQALIRKFESIQAKRFKEWPLAYLLGYKEFYGYKFLVNQHVLVPRPETELMVDYILADAEAAIKKAKNQKGVRIVDIGTGSGAIAISLAKELRRRKIYNLEITGIDISPAAIKVAKKNADKNRLEKRVKFMPGDLLPTQVIREIASGDDAVFIAANLPYLNMTQIKASPSIKREPLLALYGGPDGLKYYRRLLKLLGPLKHKDIKVYLEIVPGQAVEIKKMAAQLASTQGYRIIKDLAGKKRLAIIDIR